MANSKTELPNNLNGKDPTAYSGPASSPRRVARASALVWALWVMLLVIRLSSPLKGSAKIGSNWDAVSAAPRTTKAHEEWRGHYSCWSRFGSRYLLRDEAQELIRCNNTRNGLFPLFKYFCDLMIVLQRHCLSTGVFLAFALLYIFCEHHTYS